MYARAGTDGELAHKRGIRFLMSLWRQRVEEDIVGFPRGFMDVVVVHRSTRCGGDGGF